MTEGWYIPPHGRVSHWMKISDDRKLFGLACQPKTSFFFSYVDGEDPDVNVKRCAACSRRRGELDEETSSKKRISDLEKAALKAMGVWNGNVARLTEADPVRADLVDEVMLALNDVLKGRA